MGGGGPKSTTTTTKNEPWDEAKPYYNDMYAAAEALRKKGTEAYYPNSTVVDWSQQTKDAYQWQDALARDGNATSLLSNAHGTTNAIIKGDTYSATPMNTLSGLQGTINTGSNPYLSTFNSFANGSQNGKMPQTAALQKMSNFNSGGVEATKAAMGTLDNSAAKALQGNGTFTNAALAGQQAQADKLAGATNAGTQYLTGMAGGGTENPYLTAFTQNRLGEIQDQFQKALSVDGSNFASAGRMGSNAYANALNTTSKTAGDSMAKAYTDLAYQDWTDRQNRALQAAGQISSNYNSDVANAANSLANLSGTSAQQQGLRNDALNAAGNLQNAFSQLNLQGANQLGSQAVAQAGVQKSALDSLQNQYNQDIANQLGAANSGAATWNNDVQNMLQGKQINLNAATAQGNLELGRAGQRLQASQAAGGIYDNLYKPIDQLKQVGVANEQQAGAYLQDAINRWTAENNSGWTDLQNQAAILGSGGYGNSATTQPVYSNSGAQVLGGALSGLGALAGKCDVRLKENITAIGFTKTGIPLYCFSYKDDPTHKLHIGPMAQDVEKVLPEAVVDIGNGYKGVRFDIIAANANTSAVRAKVRF